MPNREKKSRQHKKKYILYKEKPEERPAEKPKEEPKEERSLIIGIDKGPIVGPIPAMEFVFYQGGRVDYEEVAMRNLAFWINGNHKKPIKVRETAAFNYIVNAILGAIQSVRLNQAKFLEDLKKWTFNRYQFVQKQLNAKLEAKELSTKDVNKWNNRLTQLKVINLYTAQKLGKISARLALVLPRIAIKPEYVEGVLDQLEIEYQINKCAGYNRSEILKKVGSWFMKTVIYNDTESSNCQKIEKILKEIYKNDFEGKTESTDAMYSAIKLQRSINKKLEEEIQNYRNNHIYFTAFLIHGFLRSIGIKINNDEKLSCLDVITVTTTKMSDGNERVPHIIWERSDGGRETAYIPNTLNHDKPDMWESSTIVFNTAVDGISWPATQEFFQGFIDFIIGQK